jgi:RHS repeat-associated protein
MPRRTSDGYNGMEEEDNQKGEGNALNTYYHLYDPRLGMWLGIDPVVHESQSPYSAMNGNPILYADPSGADGQATNYVVKDGETLSGIAQANGISVEDIMKANTDKDGKCSIEHKDRIYPGQAIKLPPGKNTAQKSTNTTNPGAKTIAAQSQGSGGSSQSSGNLTTNSACGPNGSCIGNRGNNSAKEPSKAEQLGLPEINSWSDAGRALSNIVLSPVKSILIVAGMQKPSSEEEKVRAWVDFGTMAFTAGEAGAARNRGTGSSPRSTVRATQAETPSVKTTSPTAPKKISVASKVPAPSLRDFNNLDELESLFINNKSLITADDLLDNGWVTTEAEGATTLFEKQIGKERYYARFEAYNTDHTTDGKPTTYWKLSRGKADASRKNVRRVPLAPNFKDN